MGNKLLIALCLVVVSVGAQSKYPDIDRLIEKVKVKRTGLSPEEIAKLKNPFIDEEKLKKVIKKQKIIKKLKKKKKKFVLRLLSIFGDRAKINGRWYRVGDKIGAYRLVAIQPQQGYVLLKSSKKSLRLYLRNRSNKIRLISKTTGSG